MDDKLEKQLVTSYPELFGGKDKPVTENLMSFGCECGDGWFDILSNLCFEIQQHIKNGHWKFEQPYEFFQIKEKFGGLRVYDNGRDDYIDGLISMAEALSYVTCETCGNKGEVCVPKNGGMWYSTKCPECAEKDVYRPYKRGEEI